MCTFVHGLTYADCLVTLIYSVLWLIAMLGASLPRILTLRTLALRRRAILSAAKPVTGKMARGMS